MKKSFFKDYVIYRIKRLSGFFIASCVLGFLSGPLQVTSLFVTNSLEDTINSGGWASFYTVILGLYILMLTVPALILLSMIIPIVTRRHLNRRAYVDTMGALPITYNQRYWGDLLSEFAAFISPLILCGIYVFAAINVYASSGRQDILTDDIELTRQLVVHAETALILSCIGGLALANLVAQCSGKRASGIMCSVLTAILLPTIVFSFRTIQSRYAIGISETDAAVHACSAIPPIGWVFTFFLSGFDHIDDILRLYSPVTIGVTVLIIAAFIAGGYFIGRRRKPELVGNGFVYEKASYAVSVGIATAVMCVAILNFKNPPGISNYIVMLVVTLIAIAAAELLFWRKRIKILGTLIRYAAVCAVGLGFFALSRATNGLGEEDYLPKVDSISEVSIYSGMQMYASSEYVYDDKNAVNVILENHKALLEQKDELSTGGNLIIQYKLKNGSEVLRMYNVKSNDVLMDFTKPLLSMPQKGRNRLSLLKDESITMSGVTVSMVKNALGYGNGSTSQPEYTVRPEKIPELRSALAADIEDNFRDFFLGKLDDNSLCGYIYMNYFVQGEQHYANYRIDYEYTRTRAFLKDPDNFMTADDLSFDPEKLYKVKYDLDDGSFFEVTFSGDDNPLPPELYALFTAKQPGEEYSERFMIYCVNDVGAEFFIRKDDEKRAAEIFLNAVKNLKYDKDSIYSFKPTMKN